MWKQYLWLLLLIPSNTMMVWAWYYHLNHKDWPYWKALIISVCFAMGEYIFHVFAHRQMDLDKVPVVSLKIIQEVIHLIVFFIMVGLMFPKFSYGWNHYVAIILIVTAFFFFFMKEF